MEGSTENFLRLMNEQNARIAAEAAKEAEKKVGVDPVRMQNDAKRREKYGALRAREKASRRPKRNHGNVFGYIDPS